MMFGLWAIAKLECKESLLTEKERDIIILLNWISHFWLAGPNSY